MTSGIPAFNNVPHDFNLSLRICEGLRPKIIECTEAEYAELMGRCWNSDPLKRPLISEIQKTVFVWHNNTSYSGNSKYYCISNLNELKKIEWN